MKKLMTISLLLSMSLFFSNCVSTVQAANHGHWIQIGEKTVDLHGDHDVMYINGWKDTFTKLKLKVSKAPVYVNSIKIVYGNGSSQLIRINRRFSPGQESKTLDLPGGHREVVKIVFHYDTINTGNGRAIVRAYGRL